MYVFRAWFISVLKAAMSLLIVYNGFYDNPNHLSPAKGFFPTQRENRVWMKEGHPEKASAIGQVRMFAPCVVRFFSGIHHQFHHHNQNRSDEDPLDPHTADPVGIMGADI